MKRFLLIIFGIIACWISSTGQNLPELIYYRFDGAGTAITNDAQNPVGNNPLNFPSGTVISGGFQGSNGLSNSSAVNTGWNTQLTGSFTVAFWIKNDPLATSYVIFRDMGALGFNANFLNGNIRVSGGTLPNLIFPVNASSGNGAMVHIVYNEEKDLFMGYVNGELVQITIQRNPLNRIGTGLQISIGAVAVLDEFRWYNRALDGIEIKQTFDAGLPLNQTCPSLSDIKISNISNSTALLQWTVGTGNSSYKLEYGPEGFVPGTGSEITHSFSGNPSILLTGLTSNTTYEVRMREYCNSGADSGIVFTSQLKTLCDAGNTFPYNHDFDDWSFTGRQLLIDKDSIFDCWGHKTKTGLSWQVGKGATSTNLTGPIGDHTTGEGQYIYLESENGAQGDSAFLFLPPLDLSSLNRPLMEFFYHMYGVNIEKLAVQVSVDTGETWHTVFERAGQQQSGSSESYKESFSFLTPYKSPFTLIRFAGVRGVNPQGDIAIDDIVISEAPSCMFPLNAEVTGITDSSVIFTWDSENDNFKVEWGLFGFEQGTGTFITVSDTDYVEIASLDPQTSYDFYVRTECSGSSVSGFTGPVMATTDCAAITSGHFDNFDSESFVLDFASINPPDCWNIVKGSGQLGGITNLYLGSAHTSPNWLFLSAGGNLTDPFMLITPKLAGVEDMNKQVRFFTQSNSTPAVLIVGSVSSPDDPSSFIALDTISFPSANVYKEYVVKLDSSSGFNSAHRYIAFRYGGTAIYGIISIDDFNFEDIPVCESLTDLSPFTADTLTGSTVGLEWRPGGGIGFDITWGSAGFSPPSADLIYVTDTFATVGGLNHLAEYDFYVRDTCANGVKSPWRGPLRVIAPCSVSVAPFIEDFEDQATKPDCWYVQTTGAVFAGDIWRFDLVPQGGATSNGRSVGSYAAVDGNGLSLSDITLLSPQMDLTSLSVPQLEFELFSNNTVNPFDNSTFYVNFWDGTQWHEKIYIWKGNSANWFDVKLPLYQYSISGPVRFAFVVDKTTADDPHNNDILFDNIRVKEAPDCPDPANFSTTSITDTSISIDWEAINAGDYTIEYGLSGFIKGNGTIIPAIGLKSYLLRGLNERTAYDIYLRANCGINGNSDWKGPFTVKTKCSNGALGAGTYTIGGSGDFVDFNEAADVLLSCGINGPVTFNITPGTYFDNLKLSSIPGASAINRVVFDGGSADQVSLNSFSLGSVDSSNVVLNEAGFITFKNITFNSNSYGLYGIGGCEGIIIENCKFSLGSNIPFVSIVFSSSPFDPYASFEGKGTSDFMIRNNRISGGARGIVITGGASLSAIKGLIENNLIERVMSTGISLSNVDSLEIAGNRIKDLISQTATGIHTGQLRYFNIRENVIISEGSSISIGTGNQGIAIGQNSHLVNNMLISKRSSSLVVSNSSHINVFHNSFSGLTKGVEFSSSDYLDIRNNIFYGNGSFALEIGTAPNFLVLDYNLYHSNSSPLSLSKVGSSVYNDLASWQSAVSSMNQHSVQGNPEFIDANADLHTLGKKANDAGDPSLRITEDIDGDIRPAAGATAPDIGADEYTPILNDASTVAFIQESGSCGSVTSEVRVVIKNEGLDPIYSLPVVVDVSGLLTTQLTATYTGALAEGEQDTILAGTINTITGGVINLKIYTNLSGDQVKGNDTLQVDPLQLLSAEPPQDFSTTVCGGQQSVSIIAIPVTGLRYGWYDSQSGGSLLAHGDTLEIDSNDLQPAYYLSYEGGNDSLSTFYTAGDSQHGIMFDIETKNSITIEALDISPVTTAGFSLEIYYKEGSYNGFTSNLSAWTLIETHSITPSVIGTTDPTKVILSNPLPLLKDKTYALYITTKGSAGLFCSPGHSAGTVLSSNPEINITSGVGKVYPFAGSFTGRAWNGGIYYSFTSCAEGRAEVSVSKTNDIPLIASFTTNNTASDYTFDASASQGADTYDWDFGDGNSGSGAMATHTYTENGDYTVTLTIEDTTGICTSMAQSMSMVEVCEAPADLQVSNTSCDSVTLSWSSYGTGLYSIVEYGESGFNPGNGTVMNGVQSPVKISDLDPGKNYDFYVTDTCSSGNTDPIGPFTFTTADGPIEALFTSSIDQPTATNQNVDLDASASIGAVSYTWKFGDGNTGIGSITNHVYAVNGSYDVELVVEGPCGSDTTVQTITISGISIEENIISRSLQVFPNPVSGNREKLHIEFETNSSSGVELRLTDVSGRLIQEQKEDHINGRYLGELDISKLAKGTYILSIESNGMRALRRVVRN